MSDEPYRGDRCNRPRSGMAVRRVRGVRWASDFGVYEMNRIKSEAEIDDDRHERIREQAGRRKMPRTLRGCKAVMVITGDHAMGPTQFGEDAKGEMEAMGYSVTVEETDWN